MFVARVNIPFTKLWIQGLNMYNLGYFRGKTLHKFAQDMVYLPHAMMLQSGRIE